MTDKNSQDLTQMSAQPLTVEIGGKKYKVSRLTIDDWGALEDKIKQDKMAMLAAALKASGEDRDYIASKMIEMMNTPVEGSVVQDNIRSIRYLTEIVYLCLKKENPDIDRDELSEEMTADDISGVASMILAANTSQAKNAKRVKPKKKAQ